MAPECFGRRPLSANLPFSLAEVILILKHSGKLRRYLLRCVIFCAVQSTAHNMHAVPGNAATPPNIK